MSNTLGIDLGTSKVAVVVIDVHTGELVACETQRTRAELVNTEGHFEQDPAKIFKCLEECIQRIPQYVRSEVEAIGITGQMHGVVPFQSQTFEAGNLVTWQDRRCNHNGYLTALQQKCGDTNLCSGYGAATLAWLMDHQSDYLSRFDRAGTIHDLLAAKLCDNKVYTDPTNAMSWGLFDPISGSWNREAIASLGIPESYFPEVKTCGVQAGSLSEKFGKLFGLSTGCPVLLPLGDNQASLYSTVTNPADQISLTIGTGGQVAVVLSGEEAAKLIPKRAELAQRGTQIWPFVGHNYIAVGASLCGGGAFGWFVDSLLEWFDQLGILAPGRDDIFALLDQLGAAASPSTLKMCSSFLGERHDPTRRGSITGIDLSNFTLGNITLALVQATVSNLKEMLPCELISSRKEIVGSGNGLRRLRLAKKITEECFGLPLTLTEAREEAARGAASLAAKLLV